MVYPQCAQMRDEVQQMMTLASALISSTITPNSVRGDYRMDTNGDTDVWGDRDVRGNLM